jgi:hypothetical protein
MGADESTTRLAEVLTELESERSKVSAATAQQSMTELKLERAEAQLTMAQVNVSALRSAVCRESADRGGPRGRAGLAGRVAAGANRW